MVNARILRRLSAYVLAAIIDGNPIAALSAQTAFPNFPSFASQASGFSSAQRQSATSTHSGDATQISSLGSYRSTLAAAAAAHTLASNAFQHYPLMQTYKPLGVMPSPLRVRQQTFVSPPSTADATRLRSSNQTDRVMNAAPGIPVELLNAAHAPLLDPHAMSPELRNSRSLASASRNVSFLGSIRPAQASSVVDHKAWTADVIRATQSVSIAAASTTGIVPWWTYVENAVRGVGTYSMNVANGNLVMQVTDMHVAHRDLFFDFTRTYNSQSKHDAANSDGSGSSIFGDGWTNTIDRHLAVNNMGGVSFFDSSGARWDFASDGQGHWVSPVGRHVTLAWDGGQGYLLFYKGGDIDYFYSPFTSDIAPADRAKLGKIYQQVGHNHNNFITFQYSFDNGDASNINNLNKITETAEDGTTAAFTFTTIAGTRELQYLIRPDSSTFSYGYANTAYSSTSGHNLWIVKRPGDSATPQPTEIYSYGTGTNSLMSDVADPRYNLSQGSDGVDVRFSYDGLTRVVAASPLAVLNIIPNDGSSTALQPSQPTGQQSANTLSLTYSQNASGAGLGVTQFSDSDGHQRQWSFDTLGRAVGLQIATGSTLLTSTVAYDPFNNLASYYDFSGQPHAFAYDDNGNLTAETGPTVTVNNGTYRPTRLYTHDIYSNLLATCDEIWTHAHGLDWTMSSQPPPNACPRQSGTYQYFYNWNGGNPAYQPTGHLSDSYTPLGYHLQYAYAPTGASDLGMPIRVTGDQFSQIDGSSFQSVQTFAYDSAGRLATSTNGQGTSKYTYDMMGRLLTATDPDGSASSNNTYNLSGTLLTTTPEGATAARILQYDADGNLVSETTNFGAAQNTTKSWYDGLGRLVEIQMPHGANDAYQFPWQERYIYDLSHNGSVNIVDAGNGGSSYSYQAHGNLFKTQRYLSATTWSTTPNGASAQWMDVSGTSYNANDQVLNRFFFPPFSSLRTSLLSYDNAGRVSKSTNGVGDVETYSYDAMSRVSGLTFQTNGYSNETPNRTYSYDAVGRTVGITTSWYGTESSGFDADGRLTDQVEAPGASSPISSPAHFTYHYYPNGMKSSLDVASTAISHVGTKQYVYRSDGALTDYYVNFNGVNYGFHNTYTVGGRLLTKRDPLNPSVNITYDPQHPALVSSYSIPQGQYTNMRRDSEGQVNSIGLQDGTSLSMTYSPRNELLSESVGGASVYAATSADGYMYPSGATTCNSNAANGQTTTICNTPAWRFDTRNNAPLGIAFNTTTTVTGSGTNSTTTNQGFNGFAYDTAGRRIGGGTQANGSGGTIPFNIMDMENLTHRSLDNTTGYGWGADHLLNSSFPASGGKITLHWDGDGLLFTTNASGQLSQLNLTRDATLLPATGQLTIVDRAPFGAAVSSRNATGSDALIVANPYNSCDDASSTVHVIRPASNGYVSSLSLCHGQGAMFTRPRADGYYDGITQFKGIRTYDASAMSWTSPDSAVTVGGTPLTQLAYSYAQNNPIAYADPSGLYPVTSGPASNAITWDYEPGNEYVAYYTNDEAGHVAIYTPSRGFVGFNPTGSAFGSEGVVSNEDQIAAPNAIKQIPDKPFSTFSNPSHAIDTFVGMVSDDPGQYSLFYNNCVNFVASAFQAGGFSGKEFSAQVGELPIAYFSGLPSTGGYSNGLNGKGGDYAGSFLAPNYSGGESNFDTFTHPMMAR